ncbi:hypothetical protein [Luteibacter sp. 3190]|uniref:hypothetical protein n=1 Tax=Luteibacter sp. 3190 TaxID=2817736 RepID=UPI0028668907|nr:hypothetical protein [Luteibacter sp. 3190]MDR6935472.1 hypothetical protein [Luteibacter sp. 3190]
MNRGLLSAVAASVILSGCAGVPVTVRDKVPQSSDVAVVMFKDCVIQGQEDCDGSGLAAGSIFARVIAGTPGRKAVPLDRPVPPKAPFTDAEAASYAKEKGYAYVVNGEVQDYYRVAPFTFRSERAGVSIRVLRASDASVVAFFSDRGEANNLSTPDAILEGMAKKVAKAM